MVPFQMSDGQVVGQRPPCAIELKRPALRPKFRAGRWWLEWGADLRADDSWHIRPSEPTRHGLSAPQALRLHWMWRCGWDTLVAYGWDEAREWIEARLGT